MADDGVVMEVTGLRELVAGFRKINQGLSKEMTKIHKGIAQTIVAEALPSVPVRSGALRASVRGAGTARQAIGRAGGAKVPYAAAQHWGTGLRAGLRGPHNIKARPFLWAAAQKVERGVLDDYADAVEDLIDRVVR